MNRSSFDEIRDYRPGDHIDRDLLAAWGEKLGVPIGPDADQAVAALKRRMHEKNKKATIAFGEAYAAELSGRIDEARKRLELAFGDEDAPFFARMYQHEIARLAESKGGS
ncbi:MAG: hypothetical protein IPG45_18120 [Deltaproteobacteria bacterium]|nr:hypothetical protein [Deltaproteobacteria bacterium]